MTESQFVLHPQLEKDSVLVGRFQLSQCRLLNDSRYLWVLLIPQRHGTLQWHQLSAEDFALSSREMRCVAERLECFPGVDRLNFGALGNLVPQLHLHIVGRHSADAAWPGPVWGVGTTQPYSDPQLQERLEWLRNGLSDITV